MLRQDIMRAGAVAALAVLAGCDKGPEIVKATWASKPTAAEVDAVYPAFARMARIPGKIEVRCNYDRTGVLSRCRRIGVAPAGLKFEDALKRLLPKYRVTPQTVDGITAPSEITFVISFNPPKAPAPFAGPAATSSELAGVRRVVSVVGGYESAMAQRAASYTVDVDRMSVASAMVDRAYKAEGAAVQAALPLALIQATPVEDRATLARGQSFRLYSSTELEAVSPEYHAAMGRLAAHIRTEYCAAYTCDPTLPVETK